MSKILSDGTGRRRTSLATQEEQRNPQNKEELIMSQTLKSVLEEQEAVFRVSGIRGGRRVTKLGVSLVAL